MKKQLLMMLAVAVLLTGCNNADNKDTEANTQQMETESSVTDQDEETSSATSETTETTSEIETEAQTEVETEAPNEDSPATTYTYTDMDKTMYAKSSVNVRDLPSTDGNKLGGLSKAQEVHVTGQCNETNWYRIEYNGGVGYVSSNYLIDEKPVEETPIQPSQPSEPEECPVQVNTIVDCGDYFYQWRYTHTREDFGQGSAFITADSYAKSKWSSFWMDGCVDHIEWNGYIICKEVYYNADVYPYKGQ